MTKNNPEADYSDLTAVFVNTSLEKDGAAPTPVRL